MKVLITAICLLIYTTGNAQKMRYFMFGYAYQTQNTYIKAVSTDNGKTYRRVNDTAGGNLASKGQYFGYMCYTGYELPIPDAVKKELVKFCKPNQKLTKLLY